MFDEATKKRIKDEIKEHEIAVEDISKALQRLGQQKQQAETILMQRQGAIGGLQKLLADDAKEVAPELKIAKDAEEPADAGK